MFLVSWLFAKEEGFDRLIDHSSEIVTECGILTEWYKEGKVNFTEKIIPYGYFIQNKSHVKCPPNCKGLRRQKLKIVPLPSKYGTGKINQIYGLIMINWFRLYANTFLCVTEMQKTL